MIDAVDLARKAGSDLADGYRHRRESPPAYCRQCQSGTVDPRQPGNHRMETSMKIASYEATPLNVPEDDPLANMPEEAGRTRPIVILRLRTDSGIEGIGVTFYGGKHDAAACTPRSRNSPR